MSYVKRYEVGNIMVDSPNKHIVHALPLLSFGDARNTFALSLIFQSKLTTDPFYIANGYKLSIQKRIIISDGVPQSYEDGNGTLTTLNRFYNKYAFDDGSYRFIRLINGQYVLENPDYSTETFATDGRILSVKDKYGNTILNYSYSVDKLVSVVYKGTKTVTFGYSNDNLQYVQYAYSGAAYKTTFTYSGSDVIVSHYSGVDYHLSYSSGSFEVFSANAGGTYSNDVSYKSNATISGNVITIEKYRGEKKLDKAVYNFVKSDSSGKASVLDITNFQNVTTRVQLKDGKPAYSYEKFDNMFVTHPTAGVQYYAGKVTYYNNDQASGSQGYGDGLIMQCYTNASSSCSNDYATLHKFSGLMTVSGWLKPTDERTSSTLLVYSGDTPVGTYTITDLDKDIWKYFTVSFYVESSTSIHVVTVETSGTVYAYDFRLAGQANSDEDLDDYKDNLVKSSGVLFHTESGIESVIPINDTVTYYNGASGISKSDYPITINDLVRFKINQKVGVNIGEIYYNDGRGILSLAGALNIDYKAPSGINIRASVMDLAVGKMYSLKNDTYTTKIYFSTEDEVDKLITQSAKNGLQYNTNEYDCKLDVVKATETGIETTYTRNATTGLVTLKTVKNVSDSSEMTYLASYDSNDFITSATDEFGAVTTYVTDPTWGVVKSYTVSGDVTVADTFDDDCSTQTQKRFSCGNDSKTHSFEYTNGDLTKLSDGILTYNFTYSGIDLSSVVKNGATLESHSVSSDRRTYSSTYGSDTVTETYDKYGRLTSISGKMQNTYDAEPYFDNSSAKIKTRGIDTSSSKLATSKDLTTNKTTKYAYEEGLVSRVEVHDSNDTEISRELYSYDKADRLTSYVCKYDLSNSKNVSSDITYLKESTDPMADGRISNYSYKVNGTEKAKTQNRYYDNFKRLTAKLVTIGSYTYDKGITYDKTRISKVMDVKNGSTFHNVSYGYDALGRIVSETDSVDTSYNNTYEYDSFGRLVRENNKSLAKTYIYEYNEIGNVTSVKAYAYTTGTVSGSYTEKTYTYNATYPDRLTKFNGTTISYDSLGRPTYYDKGYEWSKGKLARIYRGSSMQPGSLYENCVFTYDAYGRRISKTYTYDPNVSSTSDYSYDYTTTYDYDNGGRLIHEHCVEEYISGADKTRDITYLYDESGIVGAIQTLNSVTETYYFDKNIRGDVIGIFNSSGTKIANYSYDSWGNCTIKTLVSNNFTSYNPIRYRGYYYDRETKLYYLNARYYNPEWRRFISPDETAYIDPENPNGLNLYAYCNNDPVNYSDPSGHELISILAGLSVAALIGACIGATSYTAGQLVDYAFTGDFEWSWGGFVGSTIGGAVGGMITFVTGNIGGTLFTITGAFLSGSVMTSATMIGENIMGDASYSFGEVLINSIISGIISATSVGIMNKIRISGLNAGRGSYSAVSKQMNTKFWRGIIKKVSAKTLAKMLIVEAYNGVAGNLMEWTCNISGAKDYVMEILLARRLPN